MPIFDVTRQAIRWQLARLFDDLPFKSGSLSNPTLTTFHSPVLVFGDDSQLVGSEVSFYSGGGASIAEAERLVYAATPYSPTSPSLYGRVDVLQPWSAVPSINSGWEIHKLFTRQQYEDGITSAVRRMSRRSLTPVTEYMVLGSIVANSMFSYWPNNYDSDPEGWTLGGTGATVLGLEGGAPEGNYFARVRNGASSEAYLRNSPALATTLIGETVTVSALCRAVDADRARIRLLDSSSVMVAQSGLHPATSGDDGIGAWRELSVDYAVPASTTNLRVDLYTATGTAINVDWTKVQLSGGPAVLQYELQSRFAFIQDVYVSSERHEYVRIPGEYWFLDTGRELPVDSGEARKRTYLVFLQQYFRPQTGDVIKVVGQRYPTDPAEEINLPVDPEYVLNRAAAELYNTLPGGRADWKGWGAKAREWEARAQQLETKTSTKPHWGSRAVEEI